jgi:hypothetical protein
MSVKYIVIDLSKIDGDKLGEMLSKAYADGFKDGLDSAVVNAPTIPYCGDGWDSITGYSTTATNSMTIDASKSPSGICVGSDLEVPTITLANSVTAVKASN